MTRTENTVPQIRVQAVTQLKQGDLSDLCEVNEQAVLDDHNGFSIGFLRSDPPARERLENYWKGVMMMPERVLIVGRIDGMIAGALHFIRPSPINQTSSFAAKVENHFVVPWARGHGLAPELLKACEREAKRYGLSVLRLNVRADLEDAIELYESHGFVRWGTLDVYERIDGRLVAGHFYYKILDPSIL